MMLEKINKYNYEAHFLDYAEGNLSPQQIMELQEFLLKYPLLRQELEAYDNTLSLSSTHHSYPNKTDLKKQVPMAAGAINSSNYEEYLILMLDDEINDQDRGDLQEFLAVNPGISHEFEMLKHTVLLADKTIEMPAREDLKKKAYPFFFAPVFRYGVAAAIVLMLFWFFFNKPPGNSVDFATVMPDIGVRPVKPGLAELKDDAEPHAAKISGTTSSAQENSRPVNQGVRVENQSKRNKQLAHGADRRESMRVGRVPVLSVSGPLGTEELFSHAPPLAREEFDKDNLLSYAEKSNGKVRLGRVGKGLFKSLGGMLGGDKKDESSLAGRASRYGRSLIGSNNPVYESETDESGNTTSYAIKGGIFEIRKVKSYD